VALDLELHTISLIMKSTILLLTVTCCLATLAGCKSGDSITNPQNSTTVTTSFTGTVGDETNSPIAGATVTIAGRTATTDAYGAFAFTGIVVPSTRCVVYATATGYFKTAVATVPVSGGITRTSVRMMSYGQRTAMGTSGGRISIANAMIDFPADAFNGPATIAARYLDPTDPAFGLYFSGDLVATRTNGTATNLLSYGVLRVDLRDDGGNAIQLAGGKQATLTYPIPAPMEANAPSTLPLWFFDETSGVWKEEGSAARQGNNYIGTVSHFTDWNCDDTAGTAEVVGHVSCGSSTISGVVVRVGGGMAVTDANGFDNNNMYWIGLGILVTGLSPGQTDIQDLTLASPCPKRVRAKILDANGAPTPASIHWVSPGGASGNETTFDGNVTFMAMADTTISMTISAFACGGIKTMSVSTHGSGDIDAGSISPCASGNNGDMDITSYGLLAMTSMSYDGSVIAIASMTSAFVSVRDRQTGASKCLINVASGPDSSSFLITGIQLSDDGNRLLVTMLASITDSAQLYDARTGQLLCAYSAIQNPFMTADGSAIVAFSTRDWADRHLARLNPLTGQETARYALTFNGNGDHVYALSADGTRLVYSKDNLSAFTLYDLEHEAEIHSTSALSSRSLQLAWFSRDLSRAAMMASDSARTMAVVDLETGATLTPAPILPLMSCDPALSPDNLSVAYQGDMLPPNYTIPAPVIATITTGATTTTLSTPAPSTMFANFYYSGNGKVLVAPYSYGSSQYRLRIWELP
jgi:WD40 repeat protein